MAKYWVGGSGNWSDAANHWATSSGGSPNSANLPIASDVVHFDQNSGSVGMTATLNTTGVCLDLDFTGYANRTFDFSTHTLNLYGALTMISTLTVNASVGAALNFLATGSVNLTTAGRGLPPMTFAGSGSWTVQDALNSKSSGTGCDITAGSLNTNGKACSLGWLTLAAGSTLTLGASAITITGLNGAGNAWAVAQGATLSAASSTITMQADTSHFIGGGKAYGTVAFGDGTHGAGICQIVDTLNTFVNLKRKPPAAFSAELSIPSDITVSGTFTAQAADTTHRFIVHSQVLGTTFTITCAAVALANVDFQDIALAGAGAPYGGTNIGDGSGGAGLVGITAATPRTLYRLGGGGNWSDSTKWSLTSNGTPLSGSDPPPLPQDDVVFDTHSVTTPGETIVLDIYRMGRNLTCSALNQDVAWQFGAPERTMYGNLTLNAHVLFTGSGGLFSLRGRLSTQTITCGSAIINPPLHLRAPGGTYTLHDNLIVRSLVIDAGTLVTNGFAVVYLAQVVYNTLSRSDGRADGGKVVTFRLVPTASDDPVLGLFGNSIFVGPAQIRTDGNGYWSASFIPNDGLQPDTQYEVTEGLDSAAVVTRFVVPSTVGPFALADVAV